VPGQDHHYEPDDYVQVIIKDTSQVLPKTCIAKVLEIEGDRVQVQWLWKREDLTPPRQKNHKLRENELLMTSQKASRQLVDKECIAGVVRVTENDYSSGGYWWTRMFYFEGKARTKVVALSGNANVSHSIVPQRKKRKRQLEIDAHAGLLNDRTGMAYQSGSVDE
jgi:hypothetical protein